MTPQEDDALEALIALFGSLSEARAKLRTLQDTEFESFLALLPELPSTAEKVQLERLYGDLLRKHVRSFAVLEAAAAKRTLKALESPLAQDSSKLVSLGSGVLDYIWEKHELEGAIVPSFEGLYLADPAVFAQDHGITEEQAAAQGLRHAKEWLTDSYKNRVTVGEMAVAREVYAERGVKKYRRILSVSSKNCARCVAATGRVYSVDDLRAPHRRCHCQLVPVVAEGEKVAKAVNARVETQSQASTPQEEAS